jgi:hypothetical protein
VAYRKVFLQLETNLVYIFIRIRTAKTKRESFCISEIHFFPVILGNENCLAVLRVSICSILRPPSVCVIPFEVGDVKLLYLSFFRFSVRFCF